VRTNKRNKLLHEYRKSHLDNYIKLSVSEGLEECDWIADITQEREKFIQNLKGLYLGLSMGNQII
jgi:hypothetical protein